MTEERAVEVLEIMKSQLKDFGMTAKFKGVMEMQESAVDIALKSLTEIQKYRAIGTVERFHQLSEQFKPHVADKTSCPERRCNKCDKYRKENEKYHEIGTIDECREARERQRAKKIIVSHNGAVEDRGKAFCPNCGMDIHGVGMIGACFRCGQRLKWNDTP